MQTFQNVEIESPKINTSKSLFGHARKGRHDHCEKHSSQLFVNFTNLPRIIDNRCAKNTIQYRVTALKRLILTCPFITLSHCGHTD